MKYLVPGLLVEGDSDEGFLAPILRRELESIGLEAGFEVGEVCTDSVRTVRESDQVKQAAAALLEDCTILAMHHDHRERGKIETLRSRLACGSKLVGVVPVRETEAWVLAAMHSLNRDVPGFDKSAVPTPLSDLESEPKPKAMLKRLYSRGDPQAAFNRVAEAVDLRVLSRLPAYKTFLEDLTSALKELHFL